MNVTVSLSLIVVVTVFSPSAGFASASSSTRISAPVVLPGFRNTTLKSSAPSIKESSSMAKSKLNESNESPSAVAMKVNVIGPAPELSSKDSIPGPAYAPTAVETAKAKSA